MTSPHGGEDFSDSKDAEEMNKIIAGIKEVYEEKKAVHD